MKKANFLRQAHLDRLRLNIRPNAKRYASNKSWVAEYFEGDEWFLQSSVDMPEDLSLQAPQSKSDLSDLQNTKILYTAFKHLTPVQAADERFWAYLTHATFWDYMNQRWPAAQYEGKSRFTEVIQERYFFMSDRSRALVRNGLARLWWYGYTTYDSARQDPFELTGVLLKNLDVAQSILERAFSRNITAARAVLSVLLEREKRGAPFYERDRVRDLAKYLVQIGGVTIIDALEFDDIVQIANKRCDELATETALATA